MTDISERVESLKICDLFAIIPISNSLSNLDGLVKFSEKYGVNEKSLVSALQITLRAFMSQHIDELDGMDIVGVEGSEQYFKSFHYRKHPNRPRIALLDKLANCAHTQLRPLWSSKSINDLRNTYDDSKRYFESFEAFLSNNVFLEVDGKEENIDIDFLSIASGRFFADSVLNPRYSHVLSELAGSFVGVGRKKYLEKNWKGYLVVVCFFYQHILKKYYGSAYVDEIFKAGNIDNLWAVGESLWRETITLLNKQASSEKWFLKTRPKIDLDEVISLIEKDCSSASAWSAKELEDFLGFHMLQLLDGRAKYFGGPVFFIRLLLGEVEFKKLHKEYIKPVEVIKLIHPNPEEGGNRFSYGILTWSTPPGWIIFTWCGNDYSGGSKKAIMEIEHYLKNVEKFINIRTFTISQKGLEDYALYKTSIPKGPIRDLTDEEGHRVLFHEARELVERISGMNMELLVAAIFSNFGCRVNWSLEDSSLDDYEIDVTARAKDLCYIIECSHRMSSDITFAEDLISEFKVKVEKLSKLDGYDYKEFRCIYVTREKYFSDSRMKSVIAHLGKNLIEVTPIEHLIRQANLSDRQKEKMTEILKEMDCWRPGYSDLTTGSDVRDVFTCIDTRNLPIPRGIKIPNYEEDKAAPDTKNSDLVG